jgi:hypothetical protein
VPDLYPEIGRISCHVHNAHLAPTMGFNKRKMEDQRRHLAEKEAKARRATEKQILEDADHLVAVWNERRPSDADAVLADDRRGHHGRPSVLMGALPGLPHRVIGRPAVARPTPQCRSDQPNPGAIVPILPAQRAV